MTLAIAFGASVPADKAIKLIRAICVMATPHDQQSSNRCQFSRERPPIMIAQANLIDFFRT